MTACFYARDERRKLFPWGGERRLSLSHTAHALHVPIALLKTASFSLSPPFSDNNTEPARGIHRFPVAILDCVSLRPRHQIVPEHFQNHRQALIFIELSTSVDSLIISIDNTVM